MIPARRKFTRDAVITAGALAVNPLTAFGLNHKKKMNILCWDGYNSEQILGPFRELHEGIKIHAETATSDPYMIDKLKTSRPGYWDLINVNQPWARAELYPEKFIRPLNKDRFMPYFEKMLPEFSGPYPPALANDGNLLGMPQRYGPFNFVVNTDKISRNLAEDQGWNLFADPGLKTRYGVLTYDNWNIIHICLSAGINPFNPIESEDLETFHTATETIFGGAKLISDDFVTLNNSLLNGEIDAYFTGGTYTVSLARMNGATNLRSITPKTGLVNGKGGIVWVELTSVVNNPMPNTLAEDFLEFLQAPDVAKMVALNKDTYNPVSQMGNPKLMSLFNSDELQAMQFDSLSAELARSLDYGIVVYDDALKHVYEKVRTSWKS